VMQPESRKQHRIIRLNRFIIVPVCDPCRRRQHADFIDGLLAPSNQQRVQ
jgi:hypothetical protein